MPFNALSEADKRAFTTRLTAHGHEARMAADAKDLLLKPGAGMTLPMRTAEQHQVENRRLTSATRTAGATREQGNARGDYNTEHPNGYQ